jgi:hypothetical protein
MMAILRHLMARHHISKFILYRSQMRGTRGERSFYIQLEAKGQEVASFLSGARSMINDEPDTTAWFAIRMWPRMFGIFDAFANERGRDAHLQGKLAKQITSKADLFVKTPEMQRVEVLADKLPH